MDTVAAQLGLDQSFFTQFGLFFAFFLILSQIYFKPFLKIIQARKSRTEGDRAAAEKMAAQAAEKLAEYERRLAAARMESRRTANEVLAAAKKEEADILSAARDEAKKITHEANALLSGQREQLRRELSIEADRLAQTVADRLLDKKGAI